MFQLPLAAEAARLRSQASSAASVLTFQNQRDSLVKVRSWGGGADWAGRRCDVM